MENYRYGAYDVTVSPMGGVGIMQAGELIETAPSVTDAIAVIDGWNTAR